MTDALRRLKAEQEFGMRFMPSVDAEMAYKQARHVLYGPPGPVPCTPKERADLDRSAIEQARRVLLGSLLDCFVR